MADIFALALALFGFFIAFHIYEKKKAKAPLICPLRSNCNLVIHSDYSLFCGVRVEILGILYYTTVIFYHLAVLFFPFYVLHFVTLFSLALSTFAFLFSMYLTGVQAFILKEWCVWCLTSAFLSSLIFIVTILSSPFILEAVKTIF